MKKLKRGIALLVLSVATIPAFAQSDNSDFSPYWYVGLQGGVGQTIGETSIGKLLTPSVAISGGYRISSLFGVRASISGLQAKGSTIAGTYKYNYLQGNMDLTLDVASLLYGYNSDRFITPYIFAGIALTGAFNNDEAIAISDSGYHMGNLWSGSKLFGTGRIGAGANFKVTDSVALTLELNGNGLSDKFNSKRASTLDWQHNALVGVKIRFGSKRSTAACCTPAEPVESAPVEPVVSAPVEPVVSAPVVSAPVEEPVVVATVVEVKISSKILLYELDSATPDATQVNLFDEIADLMSSNPDKMLMITGYADVETGTPTYNMELSKKRAEGVRDLLIAKGVPADRITTDYKGDTVQPKEIAEENRTVICEFE